MFLWKGPVLSCPRWEMSQVQGLSGTWEPSPLPCTKQHRRENVCRWGPGMDGFPHRAFTRRGSWWLVHFSYFPLHMSHDKARRVCKELSQGEWRRSEILAKKKNFFFNLAVESSFKFNHMVSQSDSPLDFLPQVCHDCAICLLCLCHQYLQLGQPGEALRVPNPQTHIQKQLWDIEKLFLANCWGFVVRLVVKSYHWSKI